MKKRILVVSSIILLLTISSLLVAGGIVTSSWDYVPVRGDTVFIQNQTENPVAVRWDYYTLDEKGNVVIKAPGAYKKSILKEDEAFNDKDFYYFYDDESEYDEFIIQKNEEFLVPRSVWNVYIEIPRAQKRVKRGYWKNGFRSQEDAEDVFVKDKKGVIILIEGKNR